MTRREILATALAFTACGRRARPTEQLLPATVAGVWQRKSLVDLPPSPAGATRAVEGVYQGPGKIAADLYEMRSSAGALDLAQRWKPAADTVFFYKENYFVVVKWERVERKALTEFLRAMEKNLGSAS
jgi:hypothetical protein